MASEHRADHVLHEAQRTFVIDEYDRLEEQIFSGEISEEEALAIIARSLTGAVGRPVSAQKVADLLTEVERKYPNIVDRYAEVIMTILAAMITIETRGITDTTPNSEVLWTIPLVVLLSQGYLLYMSAKEREKRIRDEKAEEATL